MSFFLPLTTVKACNFLTVLHWDLNSAIFHRNTHQYNVGMWDLALNKWIWGFKASFLPSGKLT